MTRQLSPFRYGWMEACDTVMRISGMPERTPNFGCELNITDNVPMVVINGRHF